MSEKEVSDLSINRVQCPHCEAVWINGQHYWSTGAIGNEVDLAGLVCNTTHGGAEKCINPQIGTESGDSWEKRMNYIKVLKEEMKEQ